MKKISTVATQQSRNFSQQKLTIGLDLGDRIKLVLRAGRSGRECCWNRSWARLRKRCGKCSAGMPRSRIALETGMHSPWVSRLLTRVGA